MDCHSALVIEGLVRVDIQLFQINTLSGVRFLTGSYPEVRIPQAGSHIGNTLLTQCADPIGPARGNK